MTSVGSGVHGVDAGLTLSDRDLAIPCTGGVASGFVV